MAEETGTTQEGNIENASAAGAQGENAGTQAHGNIDAGNEGNKELDLTKGMQERLSRQKSQYEKQLADKDARLRELEEAEETRKREQMSEVERAKADLEAERNRAAEYEKQLSAERINSLRANIIANEAATLPVAYKALITGSDEATIKESVASAVSAFEADRAAYLSGITTPEQLKALGEAGEKLFATVTAKGSIGAPPVTGDGINLPEDEDPNSLSAWFNRGKKK